MGAPIQIRYTGFTVRLRVVSHFESFSRSGVVTICHVERSKITPNTPLMWSRLAYGYLSTAPSRTDDRACSQSWIHSDRDCNIRWRGSTGPGGNPVAV